MATDTRVFGDDRMEWCTEIRVKALKRCLVEY